MILLAVGVTLHTASTLVISWLFAILIMKLLNHDSTTTTPLSPPLSVVAWVQSAATIEAILSFFGIHPNLLSGILVLGLQFTLLLLGLLTLKAPRRKVGIVLGCATLFAVFGLVARI